MPATLTAPQRADDSEGLLATLDAISKQRGEKQSDKPDPEPPAAKPDDKPDDAPAGESDGALPDNAPPADKAKPAAKDDDAPPANLNEKQKVDWKGLRERAKKAEEEAGALRDKLALLESSAPKTEDVEALKKQLAEYEDRLTVVALERHPKFEKYFNGRTEQLLATAKTVGGEKVATTSR